MHGGFQALEPRFIYGTAWKEEETSTLTKRALQQGFRAIDTANQRRHYYEAGVGEALKWAFNQGVVDRDEVLIQTKFTFAAGQDDRMPYDQAASPAKQVDQSIRSSREHLGVEVIDSYILHGPSTRQGLADEDREVWERMEALKRDDEVGAIGISNISAHQLETLLDWSEISPDCVQNRCFARTGWDRDVRDICWKNGIVYQGFSLLTANAGALDATAIDRIAERHDKTVPQIVFRFALDVGIVPLTGTTSETHMRQDLKCFEVELDDSEIETIRSIATGR